jgi:DNA modification methylase
MAEGQRVNNIMDEAHGKDWSLFNGDSCEVLPQIPTASIDLALFSPPFSATYTYSPSDRDLGNVRSEAEFWCHFSWISRELIRAMKPGRLVCVHVADLPAYANRDGASGRKDFSGETVQHFIEAGFVYHSRITVAKDPQAAAIRTHSKGLLFVQMRRDRAALWQAWGDYVLVFRAPGENRVPVIDGFTEEEWIQYARPVWEGMAENETWPLREVWTGIRETDVLSAEDARENDDERHLCPLQLPVIERCVRLWSNPGETVLSPFAGVGSEGVGALRLGRRFVGVELKPSYFRVARQHLQRAEVEASTPTLLDLIDGSAG